MARNVKLFNLLVSGSNVDLNVRTLEGHTPLYFALISARNLTDADSLATQLVENGAQANPVTIISNEKKKVTSFIVFMFLFLFRFMCQTQIHCCIW